MKLKLTLLLVAGYLLSFAQNNEWQNPKVNEINRLPMHTNFFAFENLEKALTGCKEQSENFLTLNGNWKFNWVKDADLRPTDFYQVNYNDKAWSLMSVPGMWEVNGYGDPIYVNVGYAWGVQYHSARARRTPHK